MLDRHAVLVIHGVARLLWAVVHFSYAVWTLTNASASQPTQILFLVLLLATVVSHTVLTRTQPHAQAARARDDHDTGRVIWCGRCQQEASHGTKHCVYCDRCMPGWDHHCVFIGNCVTRGNHAAFWWFLLAQVRMSVWRVWGANIVAA